MTDVKRAIFEIIQSDRGNSTASLAFDWTITAMILCSVVSVYVGTFPVSASVRGLIEGFDCFVSIVFTVEYLLRLWTADRLYPELGRLTARVRYVCSLMAIIDFLTILPFWLPLFMVPRSMLGVRALRLVRLLRILKQNRYFDAIRSMGTIVRSKWRELVGTLVLVSLLMLVSLLLVYTVGHEAQPTVFTNAFSGLWWAVETLMTVGYGDIYPITVAGRIIGALIALLGVAAVAVPSGIIASGSVEQIGHDELEAEAQARIDRDLRHDDALLRQRGKDAEHDAAFRQKDEMLTELMREVREMRREMRKLPGEIRDGRSAQSVLAVYVARWYNLTAKKRRSRDEADCLGIVCRHVGSCRMPIVVSAGR